MNKYTPIVLIIVIAFVAIFSFYLGRKSSSEVVKEKVIYKKGETIYRGIPPSLLTIKAEFKGDVKYLPYHFMKSDTVIIDSIEYITNKVDTTEILSEFIKRKDYEFIVRDNHLGKFVAKPSVQYNNLVAFDYEETPTAKIIEREKRIKKVFTPFVMGGITSGNILGSTPTSPSYAESIFSVGGGAFYHNVGLSYQYNFDRGIGKGNSTAGSSTINVMYKFD